MSEEVAKTQEVVPKKGRPIVRDKVHVWPYLVRLEFLCAIIVIIGLTVWSIVIDAPLEEAANPPPEAAHSRHMRVHQTKADSHSRAANLQMGT